MLSRDDAMLQGCFGSSARPAQYGEGVSDLPTAGACIRGWFAKVRDGSPNIEKVLREVRKALLTIGVADSGLLRSWHDVAKMRRNASKAESRELKTVLEQATAVAVALFVGRFCETPA